MDDEASLQPSESSAETGEITVSPTEGVVPNYWSPEGIFSTLPRAYLNDMELKREFLAKFWESQKMEVMNLSLPRMQQLPPKRIRRIIKCDEDVLVCLTFNDYFKRFFPLLTNWAV